MLTSYKYNKFNKIFVVVKINQNNEMFSSEQVNFIFVAQPMY